MSGELCDATCCACFGGDLCDVVNFLLLLVNYVMQHAVLVLMVSSVML